MFFYVSYGYAQIRMHEQSIKSELSVGLTYIVCTLIHIVRLTSSLPVTCAACAYCVNPMHNSKSRCAIVSTAYYQYSWCWHLSLSASGIKQPSFDLIFFYSCRHCDPKKITNESNRSLYYKYTKITKKPMSRPHQPLQPTPTPPWSSASAPHWPK